MLTGDGLTRVMDLFQEWDTEGDGLIGLKEFKKAVRALFIKVKPKYVTELFRELDADGGGSIEYREVAAFLRKTKVAERPPSRPLAPGPPRSGA